MNSQQSIRCPATWEANLLAGSVLIVLFVGAGILTLFLNLSIVLIVGQIIVIVPVLLWIAVRRLPLQTTLRLHPISLRTALWSVLIGVACWPIVAGISTLLDQLLSRIGPYPATPLPQNLTESAMYALTFIVLAPLTEEPIYRGFILQAWLRRGKWVSLVVSGILFGFLHSQIAPLLPLTLFGIVLGILAYRGGSVLSSILAHASYNAVATLFVVLPALQKTRAEFFIIAGIVALPIAALLLWLMVRKNPLSSSDMPPRETLSWLWPIVSFLVVFGLFGLMAILEVIMRLHPNLKSM
jgi:membrane protease YdiL (CAAX protease family)